MVAAISDIRDWGRDNGWDVQVSGRLPSGLRKAYDNRDNGPDDPTVDIFPSGEESASYRIPELDYPDEDVFEVRPNIPRMSARGKAGSLLDRIKSVAPPTAKPRGRRPLKQRVPIDKLVSLGWQTIAQMVQPINLPVARIMDMQAPVAGMVLEDVIRETLLDRLLQPLARAESGGEKVWALVGPPLIVAAMTTRPELAERLVPMLKHALRTWIDIAGDQLDKVKEQEEKFQEQYGTRVDDMISLLFAPPPSMGNGPGMGDSHG
jgi:hypothetical protein